MQPQLHLPLDKDCPNYCGLPHSPVSMPPHVGTQQAHFVHPPTVCVPMPNYNETGGFEAPLRPPSPTNVTPVLAGLSVAPERR